MEKLFHTRSDCRLCRSRDLDLVVPLAPMPIATPNFALPDVAKEAPVFKLPVPLDLHLCRACGLLQVINVGNPELQYGHYVYTTSLSLGLTEHFRRYADDVIAALRPRAGTLVVELGSNDGTLLRFFKDKGMRVHGIDPATAIAAKATAGGIPTTPAFFGRATAEKLLKTEGPAGIVVANNMIANVDDLDDLIGGVRALLADDGVFIFETQYGLDVVQHNLLDTVYHEHLTYFNVAPLVAYFRSIGMAVIDVKHIETKGGSIRVSVQKVGAPRSVAASVSAFLTRESDLGLDRREIYAALTQRIARIRRTLHELIATERQAGRRVAGYGVSVGTTTLLAQLELGSKIDMLFDDDPAKDPVLSGPGYAIPVRGSDAVSSRESGHHHRLRLALRRADHGET